MCHTQTEAAPLSALQHARLAASTLETIPSETDLLSVTGSAIVTDLLGRGVAAAAMHNAHAHSHAQPQGHAAAPLSQVPSGEGGLDWAREVLRVVE
eukprot:96291-Chlamydomonas_euryale.AAC.1